MVTNFKDRPGPKEVDFDLQAFSHIVLSFDVQFAFDYKVQKL